jgi:hypothetical protein
VSSASGQAVSGEVITVRNWALDLKYKPPMDGCSPFSVHIRDIVDKDGYCRFLDQDGNVVPHYDYDHEDHCWNSDTYTMNGQNCTLCVNLIADGRIEDWIEVPIKEQPRGVRFCWDFPIFVLTDGRKEDADAVSYCDVLIDMLKKRAYPAPVDTDEAGLLKLAAGGLKPETALVLGTDHCGIVREDGKVWHFLQCGERQNKQGKWFNRDQVFKMEKFAMQGKSPLDFLEAGVYIDSPPEFLARGSRFHRKNWPTIKVFSPQDR